MDDDKALLSSRGHNGTVSSNGDCQPMPHIQPAACREPLDVEVRKPAGTPWLALFAWILAGVFATIAVVFMVLFLRQLSHKQEVCISQDCMRISTRIYEWMNTSADPCNNFYNYACGGWILKNPIPESRPSHSTFSVLADQNTDVLRLLLTQRRQANQSKVFDNASQFYQSCLKRNDLLPRLKVLIKSILDDVGLGSIDKFVFWDSFWKLRKKMVVNVMASVQVFVDRLNSSAYIITFDQSGIKLSRESYLNNSLYNNKTREAYKKSMTEVFSIVDLDLSASDAENTFALERSLAEIMVPIAARRNIQAYYDRMSLSQLAVATGMEIDSLLDGLNMLFAGFKDQKPVTKDELVVSMSTKYLASAYEIMKKTDKRTVYTYFTWQAMMAMLEFLPGEYEKIYDEYRRSTTGATEKDPWWKTCLGRAGTFFGWLFGRMFVDENFSPESKRQIEDMALRIIDSFQTNMRNLDWMDDQTKREATKKLQAISIQIGYPEWIKNDTELSLYYDKVILKDDFLSSMNMLKMFLSDKKLQNRGMTPDKNEWGVFPQIINAFYSLNDNKIVFPAGILQSPFFEKNAPIALTYGAIGMVIGHEITHGFDDEGKNYDSIGNLFKWWTNKSEENFRQKAECIVQQYSQFVAAGRKLNGRLTLGENIADNGGLHQTSHAFKKWSQEKKTNIILPSLNLNDNQLLFIGQAQVWCGAARDEAINSMIDSGVHTPAQFRVIGPLSNTVDFARAFNCPSGSAMNPVKKCTVW